MPKTLPAKSWTPIWSLTRTSSNCAKWPSMARSICCGALATRATTNSRTCGQCNFELYPAASICGQSLSPLALALRPGRLDPIRERLHELLQEFAATIVDELAMFIEQLVGIADIGFGLLHGRHVQEHQRLPQMIIGTEGPDRVRRTAYNRTRLAVPDAPSIRPGADIQRILENRRQRPVVFGRHEQNCIGGLDALAERGPLRGRRAGLQILIEKGQLADLDGLELHRGWRERRQRIRQHPVDRSLPQTPNQYAHIHRLIRDHSPSRY